MSRPAAATALVAALLTLSGCVMPGTQGSVRSSPAAPQRPVETLAIDPASAEIAAYFRALEAQRLSRRLLRTDPGDEVPITASRLADNYMTVALTDEHGSVGSGAGRPSVLRRWAAPVVYRVEHGATVPRAQRQADRATVTQLASRLSAASGHPISLAPDGAGGNFHVLILSESERQDSGDRLRALVPGIDDRIVDLITGMPRDTLCLVVAFARGGDAVYTDAVAVIRAEHPDLTRQACLHEELTQGLGLVSDAPSVRPSIFNDDQEFALITDHDLFLLRLHYDSRLTPGMSAARARPIIFSIASGLVAGET